MCIRDRLESTDQVSGGLVLGNLGAALNPALAVGIDWTLLPVLTFPALAVAGLLTLAGIGWSLARGAQLAVMLLFACAFTTIYATLAGPYYVAKALSPASLVLVTLAVLGATRLAPAVRDRRPLALGFAACLALWAAGGVYTASHYLRTSAKTPAWLEAVGERREQTAARGPALIVSPTAQTWTAWALRNPELQISQLVGLGSTPPDSALARYQTVVVEPGSQPPGPPFRPAGRVGDVEFFTR